MKQVSKTSPSELEQVVDLLGGSRVIKQSLSKPTDVHELLLRGLPGGSLAHLASRVKLTDSDGLQKAVGVSVRTLQRRRKALAARLSREQSGRAWKFAKIMAYSTRVLGSQQEAERWLESPAMALDNRRPIDLLATPAGVEMVEDQLVRMEYGVYA